MTYSSRCGDTQLMKGVFQKRNIRRAEKKQADFKKKKGISPTKTIVLAHPSPCFASFATLSALLSLKCSHALDVCSLSSVCVAWVIKNETVEGNGGLTTFSEGCAVCSER